MIQKLHINNKEKFQIKDLYFLIVLIFSGLATSFSRSGEGIIFLFLLSVFYLLGYNISLYNKRFYTIIVIWLGYCLVTGLIHSVFLPFFIFRYITYFTVAYTLFSLYNKFHFFFLFEKSVFILSVISLLFWLLEIFAPNFIVSFCKPIDLSGDLFPKSYFYSNIIVKSFLWGEDQVIPRNCGFCWEPGPFSIYVLIAMFLCWTRMKEKALSKIYFWILFITLLTTRSTTGIGTFMCLVLYIIFAKYKGGSKFIYLFLFLLLTITVFMEISIFKNKIIDLYQSSLNIKDTFDLAKKTGGTYSGGRFAGFLIAWKDFLSRPLFGTGGYSGLSYGWVGRGHIFIVNGWATILSTFGLFGIISYACLLIKSSKVYSKIFFIKEKKALFIILAFCSFGFSIISMPMLFAIVLFGMLTNN